jgi:hypothetical protein
MMQLRSQREIRLSFGTLTMREGSWLEPVVPQVQLLTAQPVLASVGPPTYGIFTLELDETQPAVQVQIQAEASFAIALHEGKAVAVGGPAFGSASYDMYAIAIDTITVYTIGVKLISFCIWHARANEEREWETEPFIVENLQLPLQELMPSLSNNDAEFAEGKTWLLPGETLNEDEFKQLVDTLRAGVQHAGPPRPIVQVLLMRDSLATNFEELVALDPIRVLLPHPKWRRVLGFGWFDNDPTLVAGDTYEYRITGFS